MRTVNYNLEVKAYSVRVYPSRSSVPPSNYAGTDLGYIILLGDGTKFVIHFIPDGANLPPPAYNVSEGFVELCMNWCQFQGLLTVLEKADSVQGIFFVDENGPWADVEGQYVRRPHTIGERPRD
jgi:hypothetical protein